MSENIKHKSVFETLSSIDLTDKVKRKKDLVYLPWSTAWAEVMKVYPDSTFRVIPQIVDNIGNERFWHDDGRTGWVQVGVTIGGVEMIETLAVMNFKNMSIPADEITSTDANKAMKRCLVKACAMHGLGLYIYMGEDIPEVTAKIQELQAKCIETMNKKVELGDKQKARVAELCKEADRNANPNAPDALITGHPKNIEDEEILENLWKMLKTIR